MPVRDEEVLVFGDPGPGELDVTLDPYQLEAFSPGIAKRKPAWVTGPDVDGALFDEEPRYDNAEAVLRVRVWQDDPTQMDAALAALGELVDKLQEAPRRAGGLPVRWTPAQSSETYTMYVLLAEIDDLPITMTGDDVGWLQARPVVTIHLTRRPFLYGQEVAPTNLVTNPSFETVLDDWSPLASSLTRTTTVVDVGTHSLQITTNSSGGSPGAFTFFPRPDVVAGLTYSGRARVRAATTPRNARIALCWYDGGGTLISETWSTDVTTSTSAWTTLEITGEAPANTTNCEVRILANTAAGVTGEVHYLDAVALVAGATPTYFDGSMTGYQWTGTPHASTSIAAITGTDPLLEITIDAVQGDVAAEARLIVTDTAGQPRRHVEWGRETLTGSAVPVIVDSDELVTTGFAGVPSTLASGTYDPDATTPNVVGVNLTTQETAVVGTGPLDHAGTWRVKARIYAESTNIRLRLAWQSGDGPFTRNAYVGAPVAAQLCEVDLGLITNPARALGTQQWSGQIEGFSTELINPDGTIVTTQTLVVDALWLLPAGDGYGKARSNYTGAPGALLGRDEFTATTAGNALNGRAAPQGGTWATSGATTDFVFDDNNIFSASGETLKRTSASDTGPRFALLGTGSYAAVDVASKVYWGTGTTTIRLGVVARYVDASNYVRASIRPSAFTGDEYLIIEKVKAGVLTTIATTPRQPASYWYSLRLTVYPSGNYVAEAVDETGAVWATLTGVDADLATGGTLATGKAGLLSYAPAASGATLYYDDFAVSTPPAESVVMYANRRLEIRSDGTLREDAGGTYWGQPPAYRGDRFWLAPAGDQDLANRIVVKLRRNDIDSDGDGPLTDAASVRIIHTPRYLAPR